MTLNREQAARLLDVGIDFIAEYDAHGIHRSGWIRAGVISPFPEWAVQQSAVRATWGASLGDAIARQVTIDELTAVLTILVPVPGGGFIIGALENWVFGQTADVLADRLEKSVQKEFGPSWAPAIAVGIGAAILAVVAVSRRPS